MTYEAVFETTPEDRHAMFADLESGEHRTFYFKHQRVIRYGKGVNDLYFYTQVEAHIRAIGYNSANITIQIPHEFQSSNYSKWATFNVRVEYLKAVV